LAHTGEFKAAENDYVYSAEYFKQEVTEEETEDVTDQNLKEPGYLVVAVVNNERPEDIKYQTIITPFESWEDIEYVLEQDWGEAGSRRE
jgi:hypothetical protein